MKARLEILLAQIDKQINVIENQQRMENEVVRLQRWRNATAQDILDGKIVDEDEVNIFEYRLGDGSYPLVPLLAAKAQVLHALAMIQATEVS